jgi:YHS domain-containing protein
MRKNFIAIFLITLFTVAASAAVIAATSTDEAKKPVTNKLCPVSGGPSSADYRAEYKGQYVYVCCKGCLDDFKADPEKFVAKMSKEERDLIKTNELCLMSKEPIKQQEFWSEDNGRKVYFCCAGCKTSFDKKAAANKKG